MALEQDHRLTTGQEPGAGGLDIGEGADRRLVDGQRLGGAGEIGVSQALWGRNCHGAWASSKVPHSCAGVELDGRHLRGCGNEA